MPVQKQICTVDSAWVTWGSLISGKVKSDYYKSQVTCYAKCHQGYWAVFCSFTEDNVPAYFHGLDIPFHWLKGPGSRLNPHPLSSIPSPGTLNFYASNASPYNSLTTPYLLTLLWFCTPFPVFPHLTHLLNFFSFIETHLK